MPENVVLIVRRDEKDDQLAFSFNGTEDIAYKVISLMLEGLTKAKLDKGAGVLTVREDLYKRMANVTTGAFDAAVMKKRGEQDG